MPPHHPVDDWLRPRARIGLPSGASLVVGVADTPETRARGLMYRDSLGDVDGLLFVFDRAAHHAFWMRHTRLVLDIAWLDAAGLVVTIAAGIVPCVAPPCPQFVPGAPASFALETLAGLLASHGVVVGDRLTIDWPGPEPGH